MFNYKQRYKAIRNSSTGELRWVVDFGSTTYVGSDRVGRDCTRATPQGRVLIKTALILEGNVCVKARAWSEGNFLSLEEWEEYPGWDTPLFVDSKDLVATKLQEDLKNSFIEGFRALKTNHYHERFGVSRDGDCVSVSIREWNNPAFPSQVERGDEILSVGEWRNAIPDGWTVSTGSKQYRDGETFQTWWAEIHPRNYALIV